MLTSLDELDYQEYEVVVVDDSTDESVQILERWKGRPRFKIGHRNSRLGFKGGALREALKVMDPRTEYVVIFDADSMPFPDSIERFLPYFYAVNGDKEVKRRDEVAAVQSYQWHVLNKSESWLTEAVRAEYAGSYMIERPFQDAVGSLKMIAGTAYMIRADILREVGWGTSLTEDWELTLKLYARGYKVVYTPWAETPAECVSTFARLARQRMRWAEGHTYNVRRWFLPIMLSPFVRPLGKVEFLFDAAYYLQAALFVVGTRRWLLGPRAGGYARKPVPITPTTHARARPSNRWIGWIVATGLLLAFGALAWGSTRVPIVQAAGNPLYLHGGALCTAPSLDQTTGSMATPCSIQSTSGGVTAVFGFTNLPAQTVAAGTWSFTMNWTGGNGNTNDTVTLSAGISLTSSCTGFVATVPNGLSTWTATYGSSGANLTSPFTVTTSASQLPMVIPAGGSLCLQVVLTHNTGGQPSMVYDWPVGTADTRLVPPSSVVPESLVGWLG